jgi:HD-like signal output (HDOD) protein
MKSVATLTLNQTAFRDKALSIMGQLLPFSPVLNKLLASLAKEDVPFSHLAEWIEKDTVLSGHVLRLVNSAAYGMVGTISSVRHAISILGLLKLRNTALGLSVCRMWTQVRTPKGWSTARFNLHAAATAVMSDLLAQRMTVEYPEGAFVAGLMQDVGRLLIAMALPQQYVEIQQKYEAGEGSLEECEMAVLGFAHPELSSKVLAKWNLPEPICRAVELHDDPPAADGKDMPLAQVLFAANRAVAMAGVTATAFERPTEGKPEDVFAELGLEDQAPRLMEEFQTEYDTLRSFF